MTTSCFICQLLPNIYVNFFWQRMARGEGGGLSGGGVAGGKVIPGGNAGGQGTTSNTSIGAGRVSTELLVRRVQAGKKHCQSALCVSNGKRPSIKKSHP